MKILGRIWQSLLDLIFPPLCVGCGKEGSYLCDKCAAQILPLERQICPVCGAPSKNGEVHKGCQKGRYLDGLLVAAGYHNNSVLKKAITYFKYIAIKNAAPTLGRMLKKTLEQSELEEVVLVPVPLHYRRRWWRGYNQAEELLKNMGEGYMFKRILKRKRYTKPQVKTKTREERLANLQGAFYAVKAVDPRKLYIVVDDVSSTGATLEECAKALKKAGAQRVWGLVLAKG